MVKNAVMRAATVVVLTRGRWGREAWMAKSLACRIGRHSWTTRVEGGETYRVCAACGKAPSGPRGKKPLSDAYMDPGSELERPLGDDPWNERK